MHGILCYPSPLTTGGASRAQNIMKPIQVGLLGIGTVGGGTFTVLNRNQEEITRRAGRPIQITMVADKNLDHARTVVGDAATVTDDAFAVVRDPNVDIVEPSLSAGRAHTRNRSVGIGT